MKIVVDTNILVSFFRPNPVNELISKSKLFGISLSSSEYNIEELKNNKQDILKYADFNSKQFEIELSRLITFIKLIPEHECKDFESEAKQISPHDKDNPVFALALKLDCPIWSDEPAFKQQSRVKVFSTRDIIELFL